MPEARAQVCDSLTPAFNVNLTGQPNGTWTSIPVLRDGNCCGTDNNCIEFIILLDSNANGILFDIVSGALPGGALFYQVNCGPLQSIGTPVCLSGPGPHILTFCKPGNNLNVYQISSIPKPSTDGTRWVSEACAGNLHVQGLIDTSIHWTSIPYNALYNSYLNCLSGCDSVTVTPTGIVPPYVDYEVCGYVIGGCIPFYYCDTMRVHFANTLGVNITPPNPVICFGGPNATITANTTGGLAPFSYLWSNGSTAQSIAAGPGTYVVQLTDSMNCSSASDTVVVTALALPITADAGPDILFCTNQQSIQLNGIVTVAGGGQWLGGSGKFTPDDTTLNAIYVPSSSEINAGQVQLMLVTTGNFDCPPDTDLVTITISPNPVPVINGNTTLCEYTTSIYTAPVQTGITYNWNTTGGTIISSGTNSITIHWNNAGPGTITLTATNLASCDSTITIPVIIEPKPVPLINGPPVICTLNPGSFTLSNPDPNNTYSWSVSGGGAIMGSPYASAVSIQWFSPGNGSVSVTETNPAGCDSTVSFPVTVLAQPSPSISGPTSVCDMQVTTYSTPYVSTNSYSWNVTGGNILSIVNNSITVQWNMPGNGTVMVTQYNTLACDSTVILNVVIGPQPVPVITGPAVVCTTTNSLFTVVNPNPNNTYSWTVNGNGGINGSSYANPVNIHWYTPGNATVTLTETNAYGCDSTVSFPVTILAQPVPFINGPPVICEGQVSVYSTGFVNANTYSWTVNGGTVLNVSNNSITVHWASAGSGSVTVSQYNTAVCDSTVTLNVIIHPQPVPVITGPTIACTGTYGQYAVASPDPANTYNWYVSGGMVTGPLTGNTMLVQWNNTGTGQVMVTETNGFGCDSTVLMQVTLLRTPAPVLSGPSGMCQGDTSTYSVPFVAGDSYFWSVTNGSIINMSITNQIQVLWNMAGTGIVSLRQVTPGGCDSVVSATVLINPQPQPVVTGPTILCEGEHGVYTVVKDNGNSYNWSVTAGTATGSLTGDSLTIWWTTPGPANLSLIETTLAGCSARTDYPVLVQAKPHPVITGEAVGCVFQQQGHYTTATEPGIWYQWTVSGGHIVSGNGTGDISVQWTAPGIQLVSVTALNPITGCDSMVSFTVQTDSLPQPVIQAGSLTGCAPVLAAFSGNTSLPGYAYQWDFGDGLISFAPNPSHEYSLPGTYLIQLILTNNTGCADTANAMIMAYESPEADFLLTHGAGPYYLDRTPVILENHSSGAVSYFWTFGNGDSSTAFEPVVLYTEPGHYAITLVVTNQWGCQDRTTRYIDVKVPEEVFVPSAFSPNGDGKNDNFNIGTQNIVDFKINIYNRWGENVYLSDDPDFKWDGRMNGQKSPEDVYVYVITATGYHGQSFKRKGTVTLVR